MGGMYSAVIGTIVVVCALIPSPAVAVVGEIDTENRFPFVVRLEIGFGENVYGCSGSVSRAGLISTAAHCVWDDDVGLPDWVRIYYSDADAREMVVGQRRIFVPPEYPAASAQWKRDSDNGSPDAGISFHKMTLHDIAFIVPDAQIEVVGFPHWATEALDAGAVTDSALRQTFGAYDDRRALVVGYGNFECDDYNEREDNCRSDGQRRFVEVPINSRVTVGSEVFSAPNIWCTGRSAAGTNPVQHGDSGGPAFIQAVDGRWLFVGYTSGGNASQSCASSIFNNLDTWREAAEYYHEVAHELPADPAYNWETAQMTYILREVLENWSSPSEQAIARLDTLYSPESVYFNGRLVDTQVLRDVKAQFYGEWPQRRFELQPWTIVVNGDEIAGDPTATISARVTWTLSNPDFGTHASGESEVEISTYYGFDMEIELASGGQPITLLSEKHLIKSGDFDAVSNLMTKGSYWTHNGSTMILEADGQSRRFLYDEPRSGLIEAGVDRGIVLFAGQRLGDRYRGTAYVFSSECGPIDYEVEGPVSADQLQVDLYGDAPQRNGDCEVVGYRNDHLVFSYRD